MNNPEKEHLAQGEIKKGKRKMYLVLSQLTYNCYMSGSDEFDQYHSSYISCKSRHWWVKILYYLIDATRVNSYIFYKETNALASQNKPKPHLAAFIRSLANELVDDFCTESKRGQSAVLK
jgi:hypothetical protein